MIPSAAPAADGVDEVEGPQHLPSSANQGQGFDGRHLSTPAPTSQERDQATGPHPARLGGATPAPSSTGGDRSKFQPVTSRDRFVTWLTAPAPRSLR